jgi:hypothetical protein
MNFKEKSSKGKENVESAKAIVRNCFQCGKSGHLKRNCPEKRVQAQGIQESWKGRLEDGGATILLDSCADVSCISDRRITKELATKAEKSEIVFKWGLNEILPSRKYSVELEIEGIVNKIVLHEVAHEFINADVLLSRKDAARFGYQMRKAGQEDKDPEEDLTEIIELPVEYGNIVVTGTEDLQSAASKIPMAECLQDLREPANLGPARFVWTQDLPSEVVSYRRKYSLVEKEYLKKRTLELEDAGILQKGFSTYASPWHCVKKKDGTLRDVIDMRRVNQYMSRSAFPVTTTEDILFKLGGYKRFG